MGRKHPAVNAVILGVALHPEVANPRALMAGCGMLHAGVVEVVPHFLRRDAVIENLHRAGRFDRTARMHGHRGGTTLDALHQALHAGSLVFPSKEGPEVLHVAVMNRRPGLQARAPRLMTRRQVDAIRGKAVTHQIGPHTICGVVVVEYSEQDSAHIYLLAAKVPAVLSPKTCAECTPALATGANRPYRRGDRPALM